MKLFFGYFIFYIMTISPFYLFANELAEELEITGKDEIKKNTNALDVYLNLGMVISDSSVCDYSECSSYAPAYGIGIRKFVNEKIYLLGEYNNKGTRKGRLANSKNYDFLESTSLDFGIGYRLDIQEDVYAGFETNLSYIHTQVDGADENQSYDKRYEQISPSVGVSLGYRFSEDYNFEVSVGRTLNVSNFDIVDTDLLFSAVIRFGGEQSSDNNYSIQLNDKMTNICSINKKVSENIPSQKILFENNSYSISIEQKKKLNDMVVKYNLNPFRFSIIGSSSIDENGILSMKRSNAVEEYLISMGVKKYQIDNYWSGDAMGKFSDESVLVIPGNRYGKKYTNLDHLGFELNFGDGEKESDNISIVPCTSKDTIYGQVKNEIDNVYVIRYDIQSYTIKNEYYELLDDIVENYKNKPFKVSIIGSSDSLGQSYNNNLLSENRAKSVRDYLISSGLPLTDQNIFWSGKSMSLDVDSYFRSTFIIIHS